MLRPRDSLAVVLALAVLGCKESASIDRGAVYLEIASNVIAPAYADLRTRTAALDTAATAYCADASSVTSFDALRTAYLDAQTAYQRTLAFEITSSPPVVALIPARLETYPLATTTGTSTTVEQLLADTSGTPIDFSVQPSAVQGLYAVEYLLYQNGDASTAIGQFTDVTSGARRCGYLTSLTATIATLADTAADAWDPPGPTSFGTQLAHPGAGSPYPTVGSATTAILQKLYDLGHDLSDVRLGRPLGLVSTGTPTPDPGATPGQLAHSTKADLQAALDGFENLYLGRYGGVDGRGISDIVRTRSEDRDAQLLSAIAAARDAIDAIPGTVETAVVDPASSDYAAVVSAFDALKTLQTLVGSGIGPLLGVSSAAFETDND